MRRYKKRLEAVCIDFLGVSSIDCKILKKRHRIKVLIKRAQEGEAKEKWRKLLMEEVGAKK